MQKTLNVEIYKDNGDFQKSNIEFQDEKAFHIIGDALVTELKATEEIIKFVTNDNVRKMYQEKFDRIVGMLDQLNKPIIKQMKKVD